MCMYMYNCIYSKSISCRRLLSLFSLSSCINVFVCLSDLCLNCLSYDTIHFALGLLVFEREKCVCLFFILFYFKCFFFFFYMIKEILLKIFSFFVFCQKKILKLFV